MKMFFQSTTPLVLDRKSGYVHDRYDPLPGQQGEGKNGTGLYLNVIERTPVEGRRTVLHAFAMDDYGASAGWHFKQPQAQVFVLEGPGGSCRWELTVGDHEFSLIEAKAGRKYTVAPDSNGDWSLHA
jgi:hypothetical protein